MLRFHEYGLDAREALWVHECPQLRDAQCKFAGWRIAGDIYAAWLLGGAMVIDSSSVYNFIYICMSIVEPSSKDRGCAFRTRVVKLRGSQ